MCSPISVSGVQNFRLKFTFSAHWTRVQITTIANSLKRIDTILCERLGSCCELDFVSVRITIYLLRTGPSSITLPQMECLNTKSTSSNTPHPTESRWKRPWKAKCLTQGICQIESTKYFEPELDQTRVCWLCSWNTWPPPPVVSCGSLHLKTSAPSQRCHTHGRTSCPVRQRLSQHMIQRPSAGVLLFDMSHIKSLLPKSTSPNPGLTRPRPFQYLIHGGHWCTPINIFHRGHESPPL